MMEKPLAVNMTDRRAPSRGRGAGRQPVIVNYETTWYRSHGEIWQLIHEQKAAGEIRRMVAHGRATRARRRSMCSRSFSPGSRTR